MSEMDLDDDFAIALTEEARSGSDANVERANRFYDRVRGSIARYLEAKGGVLEKGGEYLLLVPDIFMLLWRLLNDSRVSSKNKMRLASGVAYYIFPFDMVPEGFLGPIGFLDDLVFAIFLLNGMLSDTDPGVLHEHWSGKEELLPMIQRVLGSADRLVTSDVLNKVKKMAK
jgi:uncharacterized membrane protein YkvA (DUF1232 family)